MDVKCERCNAEYDFDESLLGDKGTTVKCSSCGHVFRVLPRRGAARPSLKLRYVRGGHIEVLHSLRDLQTRIRNGEVSFDDQLGREGFPWRRLGDVPELKNFFARNGAASSSMGPDATPNHNQLRVSQTSMPPPNDQPPAGRPQPGRTVLGVGPAQPHIPAAPRVPTIAGAGSAPAHPREPVASAPAGGRFGSEAPTAARQRPADMASLSQAPTVPGVSPAELRAPQLRTTPSGAPGAQPTPQATSVPVRGLYLAEDEAPPARATSDSSKIWVYATVLLLLAGGGWLAVNALAKKPAAQVPPAAAPRVETPAPSPAVLPTAGEAVPQANANTPTPASAGQGASAPAPAQATAQKPAEPQAAPDRTERDKSRGAASSSSSRDERDDAEPKDYGGWVSKGDKARSKGDHAGARKAYEAALSLRGTGSEANAGMGFTLLGEGKASEALPYLDRAAGSGYAEASVGLGDAYRRLGQKAAAAEAYKEYLERLPNGSRATYAKRQLESLQGSGAGGTTGSEARGEPAEEEPSAGPSEYRPAGELEPGAAAGEAP